jgi:predicted nucleic acid-binding protein
VIVVDTQVLWYATVAGDFSELASQVADRDARWIAPPLWRSEFRNVALGYIRRRQLSVDEAIEATGRAMALLSAERDPDTRTILTLGDRSKCTAYDLEYVAVARALGVPLVTNDAQILSDFPGIAVSLDSFAAGSA